MSRRNFPRRIASPDLIAKANGRKTVDELRAEALEARRAELANQLQRYPASAPAPTASPATSESAAEGP